MRVLQVMAGARHGGAEAFFTRLAIALHRAGLTQRVVLRDWPERVALLRQAGLDAVPLPFAGAFDLWTRYRLAAEIGAFRPDVVLSWMGRATKVCPRPHRFVHAARLGGYYRLGAYRHCQHLIGNTRDIVAYLVGAGWPAERAHYLPNFVTATPAAPVARARLDTPAAAPLVLALGRLHPNKGFDVLLAALAAMPGCWLWLAGEGPLQSDLQGQAARLGIAERVRFLGWREDTPALFAAADVLACPSRLEPLGNVIIEAWAQGVPVVAAASRGPAALITDGESGLLAPVDDPAALAAQLRRVVGDDALAGRLVAGGRAAHAADHLETAVVAGYRDFFQRVTA
ncbi:MAG: glycosyltransferase [Alphaproteobacteria bacterium]|nr:glycosyltransferase [Alphaproteobacteria bacterium]